MKTLLFLLVWLTANMSSAQTSISGEIVLKEGSSFTDDAFVRTFGETVKATTSWRVGDFFGAQTVFAGITVTNTGTKVIGCRYYVAFFDAKRTLIGAEGQDADIKPGQATQFGSCLIKLPKDKYKQVKFYEAVIYEQEPRSPKSP